MATLEWKLSKGVHPSIVTSQVAVKIQVGEIVALLPPAQKEVNPLDTDP